MTKLGASRWIALGVAATALLAASAVVGASLTYAALAASPTGAPASVTKAQAAAPAKAAAVSGETLFQDSCGNCHDLAVSTDLRKSRADWQATVTRMVTSGAALSDAEAAQVVDYLTKNYGLN